MKIPEEIKEPLKMYFVNWQGNVVGFWVEDCPRIPRPLLGGAHVILGGKTDDYYKCRPDDTLGNVRLGLPAMVSYFMNAAGLIDHLSASKDMPRYLRTHCWHWMGQYRANVMEAEHESTT